MLATLSPHVEWLVVQGEGLYQSDVHVVPEDDLKPHTPLASCWCRPKLDPEADGVVYVHNSLDRREMERH